MTGFNRRGLGLGTGVLALAAWMLGTTPVLAHHPMGGETPSTFLQGLLSGFGHPVIGPDHFAFIIAIGIAAALVRSGATIIGAFITASTAGVMLHLDRIDVPMIETLVAISVIAGGLAIAVGRGLGQAGWLMLVVAAGLLHGYAFGEAVIGAETSVVGAYLLGLAIVSAVIATGVMLGSRVLFAAPQTVEWRRRAAGSALGVIGLGLLALSFVGA